MVDCSLQLDFIFGSLADPTRRDILSRIARQPEMSVSDIAKPYSLSLAAISKHLKVLEKAKLIIKRRRGKEQIVCAEPAALQEAAQYLKSYEKLWNDRLNSLDRYLSSFPQ